MSILPEANAALKTFIENAEIYRKKLEDFEVARCEQIHSSINQFVVFEKFAEMNNKYDVNNFSKLIDDFNLDIECEEIQKEVNLNIKRNRLSQSSELNQTIFDPLISKRDKNMSRYEFAQF